MEKYSIAIDGPAGSGKSTIAKEVAEQLNFVHVNSGMFYRAIAIYLNDRGINYKNQNAITEKLLDNIPLVWDHGEILLDGKPIELVAMKQKYADIASTIAQYPIVREFVNKNINQLTENFNVVVDGRDIGTLVLPNATAKIFLDADVTTRALRRLKQDTTTSGININTVINDIIRRDTADYSRPIAPLAQAPDAKLIDCSELSIQETVDQVKKYFMEKVTNANWKD